MQKTKDGQQSPNIHIAVENFGPIEKAEIDIRPLNPWIEKSDEVKAALRRFVVDYVINGPV